MKVIRTHVYRTLKSLVGILDYQEKWRKLNVEEITELCIKDVNLFSLCIELKREIDSCSVLTEAEEQISVRVREWQNKLFEGA